MVLNLTALLCKLLGSKKLILSDILSRPSISVVAGSGAATVARVSYWRYLSLVGAGMMMMFVTVRGMESTILGACRKIFLAIPEEPSRIKMGMGDQASSSKSKARDTVLRASPSIVLYIPYTVKHHAHVCKR